jgi:hypothetical protein
MIGGWGGGGVINLSKQKNSRKIKIKKLYSTEKEMIGSTMKLLLVNLQRRYEQVVV